MSVRLLATDLDGTLVGSDGLVSANNRAALQRAAAAGLLVVFVTGRPPRWLGEIGDATGHTGIAVASNGAVLYDLAADRTVSEHVLSPELMRVLTSELRAAFPAVYFGVEYGTNFGHEPGYRHDWEISPSHDRRGNPMQPPLVAALEDVIARPAVKLLAKDREADPDRFWHDASTLLAGRASVTHASSYGLLEIAPPGVTKASGLAEVAASHGIGPEEVAAVGDMPNDLPMLQWAGTSYAVANAHPAVLAAADHVIGSNDEDAVGALIDDTLSTLT
ncbi:MAG: HAD family hydrolase [Actinobacteria bacterium]|nr:HAD family hydrolase [Actinomycetota bacterium]